MAAPQNLQRLYYMPKPTRWSRGIGAELPEAYKKFWKEWKLTEPQAVHYIKEEGSYKRLKTGEVLPVQNVPIPVIFPKEFHQAILGGEAIIQGFVKKGDEKSRVPHYWFPRLRQSVVYSEVLDKYMKTVVTYRAITLINQHYGFDHYLLKTRACDLKTELAVGLKRQILIALADKTLYPDDPEKREEVYDKYKDYLNAYTREEIEWYGLSWDQALKKWIQLTKEKKKIVPLKVEYRAKFIQALELLKESGYRIDKSTPIRELARAALEEQENSR